MGTRDLIGEAAQSMHPQPPGDRPKALICKSGPAEVVDICLMHLSKEADVEQVPTLAEAMSRCLAGEVDILFVNLFSFTARELTALSAFRSMMPSQPVVAVAGTEMRNALIGADLADEVFILSARQEISLHPRA